MGNHVLLAGIFCFLSTALVPAQAAVTFTIPTKVGANNVKYAPLDPAPIGLSFEFFAFPSYFTNVTATKRCLANWKDLTGVWPPIRIGGTTQDRAQFDASTSAYVVYSVKSPADAPMTLTFGPRFMSLAGTYEGSVVVGLNRGKNNIENTIAAAKAAVAGVGDRLLAIELGNEPECLCFFFFFFFFLFQFPFPHIYIYIYYKPPTPRLVLPHG